MSRNLSRPRRGAKPTSPKIRTKPKARHASAVETSELLAQLGGTLRAHRVQRGLTQARAAEKAGLHIRHYCRMERAQQDNVTLETLWKLGNAFSIDPADLLAGVLPGKEIDR